LLLLAKDLDDVLELPESCSFSVNVLPSGFGALSCYLHSCDSFLFLTEPFNLLLDSSQLLLLCSFVFSVFHLDLLELYILLNDLNWRRCSRR
jgi:hypothetical protein